MTLARIRIALPYRAATAADLRAVARARARLRAANVPDDDEVAVDLRDFEQTLEILVPPASRG